MDHWPDRVAMCIIFAHTHIRKRQILSRDLTNACLFDLGSVCAKLYDLIEISDLNAQVPTTNKQMNKTAVDRSTRSDEWPGKVETMLDAFWQLAVLAAIAKGYKVLPRRYPRYYLTHNIYTEKMPK
eukprot:scaffold6408_cov17-Prasinocladus_malaysianus.AAC.1